MRSSKELEKTSSEQGVYNWKSPGILLMLLENLIELNMVISQSLNQI